MGPSRSVISGFQLFLSFSPSSLPLLLISHHKRAQDNSFFLVREADQFVGGEAKEAICGDSKGTHHFFAPEMCDGQTEKFSGYKVDIWAAGVTLYCMIFGNVPFFDDDFNTHRLFEIICTQPLIIPKGVKLEAPLKAVLEGMLDKNPLTRLSLSQIAQHEFLATA